jgi:glycosyltransferase involved in cell wall biosynthesis
VRGPLQVGMNLIPIGEGGGGVARYAVELAAAMARREDLRLHLFTSLDAPEALVSSTWLDATSVTRLPVRIGGPPAHLAAQFGAVPALALARRLDVLHSPANAGPVRVPRVACVITLHDAIWLRMREQWSDQRAVRTMHRVAVPTVRRADRLITVSRDAARDLVQLLNIPVDRIDVAHHGVRVDPDAPATPENELRDRLGLGDDPVVLCVAQKRPYKNQDVLVRALADERVSPAHLVLPGAKTAYEDTLRSLATELGVMNRLHLPGWLDDRDLEGLYELAHCFALPSRLEGFGLPVLEAMARGVPVTCSDRSALPEVVGDAALLFDPDDREAVAGSLARLLDQPRLREELAERGRKRAARFSWQATAEATVDSYRRAVRR